MRDVAAQLGFGLKQSAAGLGEVAIVDDLGEILRKVDIEKRKKHFEWPAATRKERRLIPKERALSEIGRTSGLGRGCVKTYTD